MHTRTSSYQVQYTSVQHRSPRCCRTHNDNTAAAVNTAHSSAASHRCGRRRSLWRKHTHTHALLCKPVESCVQHTHPPPHLRAPSCAPSSNRQAAQPLLYVQKQGRIFAAINSCAKSTQHSRPLTAADTPGPARNPKNPSLNPKTPKAPCTRARTKTDTQRPPICCPRLQRQQQQLHPSGRWLLHLLLPGGGVHHTGAGLVAAAVAVVEQPQLPHGLCHHHIRLLLRHDLLHGPLHLRVGLH